MSGNELNLLKKKIEVKAGLFTKNGNVSRKPAHYSGERLIMGNYTGQIKNGFPHGSGKFEGNTEYEGIFKGDWIEGVLSGTCYIYFPNIIYYTLRLYTYEGQIIKGEITGEGTMIYFDREKYIGTLENSLKHGNGVLDYSEYHGKLDNGVSKYQGQFEFDKKHGIGTLFYKDGSIYHGEWVNDKREGKGKFQWADGATYDGEWANDKMKGKGKYSWANGDTFEGDFLENKRFGNGVIIFFDTKEKYDGQWVDDLRNGEGILYLSDGTIKYKGTWMQDEYDEGNGVFEYENGDIYKGDWQNKKKHGKGLLKYSGGATYEGEFFDDLPNGFGIYRFGEGKNVYEGEFKKNIFWGKGVMNYFDTEEKYDGQWVDGTRDGEGILYLSDGTIKYKGTWVQDEYLEGNGVFEYENGDIYKGDWQNKKRQGKGLLIYSGGATYEGDFFDDLPNGVGIYKFGEGKNVYEGGFKKGVFCGKGVMHYFDTKEKFDGEWKDGKRFGNGTLYDVNGNIKLTGEWDDEFLGTWEGTAYFDEYGGGGIYVGTIRNKSREGKGEMTYENRSDGLIRSEGEWTNNKLTRGTCYFSGDHKIAGLFTGSEVYDAGTGFIDLFDDVKFEGSWNDLGFLFDENFASCFLMPEFKEYFLATSFENGTNTGEHLYHTEMSEPPFIFSCLDEDILQLVKAGKYDSGLMKINEIKEFLLKDSTLEDSRLKFLSTLEIEIKKIKSQKLQQDVLSKFGTTLNINEGSTSSGLDGFDDFM